MVGDRNEMLPIGHCDMLLFSYNPKTLFLNALTALSLETSVKSIR